MIDKIFTFESTRARQRRAPLLREREEFLTHLHEQGTSFRRLKSIAAMLLQIIRILPLESPRPVDVYEVKEAADSWKNDSLRIRGRGMKNAQSFSSLALR